MSDTGNFGYAEYPDALLMFEGLRKIGAPAVVFTLGQDKTPDGLPGWQTLKLAAAPSLRGLPRHVSETLPPGGKGQVINESYDTDSGLFRFPRTDGGEPLIARGAVIVDDSIHNLEVVEPALGILIDRKSEMSTWPHPSNVHIVRSLVEVPEMVAQYMREINTPN